MRQHAANSFRERLLGILRPLDPGTPLLLSGGTDSATILAALLALDRHPVCYSFRLGSFDSPDIRVARSMTATFGLEHRVVTIPRTPETLVADIRQILRIIPVDAASPRKTHVQCAHPFLYLAEAVAGDGFPAALSGLGADDLYGTGRRATQGYREQGEAWCRKFRTELANSPHVSDFAIRAVCAAYTLDLIQPYREPALRDFILATPYAELHQPVQKGIALRAFPEFWKRGTWYRRNQNLQVVSGIREWHDTLLSSPLNTRGAKVVTPIYRALLQELHRDGYLV